MDLMVLLKQWFLLYKREFLWRIFSEPYKILIAEFMLQRTKAEQVEPVYKAFLKQYPTIAHLSKARPLSVAEYTNKLGLHWRYKHFITSAKYITKELNGEFPRMQKDMLKIPGVGDYVAGAVLAVCYNSADYVIDSNIARFINRYYGIGLEGEIRRKKIIIDKAKDLFNTHDQRNLLFALLDYTALICKPHNPACDKCIFNNDCCGKK